jgi:ribonuclease-3
MKTPSLDELESALGYRFARRELLLRALTHSSFAREQGDGATDNEASNINAQDNEELEFLGDAVLQLISTEELVTRYPGRGEGELSRLRAHLVNATHLRKCANQLKLGEHLRLGRGEEKSGGRRKSALLADACEAVLAALYLDGGMAAAREFVVRHVMGPELERLANGDGEVTLAADHKTRLQQVLLAEGRGEPIYELAGVSGPAHQRQFVMCVVVAGKDGGEEFRTEGSGATKKAASQQAAERALARLEGGDE